MSISVMILTLNEEQNLPDCIGSVSWCDDVVVLDSLSTDGTKRVAEELGARVIERKFDNWASHQNWAMENIRFKHDWVFYLDADERMSPELQREIQTVANDPGRGEAAFYVGRKNFFMGKWIRHAMPPGTIMRFFRPDKIRFQRLVNPTPVVDGPVGYLEEMFLHYNFSKGLTEWIDKHNKYSQMEAIEGRKVVKGEQAERLSFFSGDRATRRQALKNLAFRMPFRLPLKFFYLYVIKRGFLDGRAGFLYCRLQLMYEFMIVIKMKELARRERGLPV